ncbi:MAG TPA: tetratricopeptide repeat protein [Beijerinckiaceae bacterium]|nr:tetratricopeptide repeat protein [Beijerinckiaceae bacterium]
MSDIFREVDEEFKRDQVAQTVKKHSNLIIGLLLAVVIGVGGYRTWQYFETKKAIEAGQKFEVALALASDGKADEAKAAFEAMAREAPKGYQMLARFRLASDLARTDVAGAIKAYEALAADASIDQTLRDLASVRAGVLMVDTAGYDDLKARLEPHVAQGKAWRLAAREALGLSAYKAGQLDRAGGYFEQVLADPAAGQAVRQRAEMMLALVRGGAAPAK